MKILGAVLIAIPLIILFVCLAEDIGIWEAIKIYAASILVTSMIVVGTFLLFGG